jgi:DNA-binding XRE family transcriptional regulator
VRIFAAGEYPAEKIFYIVPKHSQYYCNYKVKNIIWVMKMYQRVRDLREDHDKTQKEIAQVLNMQLTVYQRYERGERDLPLWAAIKLADYYGVTLDYLVGRA